MERTIKAYVYKGDTHYVAECLNIAVVTQGKTLDETIANLREAVGLYLQGEDPQELGIARDPTVLTTVLLNGAVYPRSPHAAPRQRKEHDAS